MAKRNIVGKIQMRSDTAEAWASKNPVLDVGEIGYDITNKRTKIGDGSTPWNFLLWFAIKTPPNFSTDSWSEIAEYSASGVAKNFYKIGDEKTIELTTGEEITLVILGFNHDDKTGGGKAGITIGIKDVLSDLYKWNETATVVGGWGESDIRKTMLTLFTHLPVDLQNVIKTVNKKYVSNLDSFETKVSSDKLWLLSLAEIYSKTALEQEQFLDINVNIDKYITEGKQYDYWKNLINDNTPYEKNAALIKHSPSSGNGIKWALRSVAMINTVNRCYIGIDSRGDVFMRDANLTVGVSYCFCV